MTGLIFFGVVIAYVALFWVIVAKASQLWLRIGTIAVGILIPFWELPIGLTKVSQLCATDGGMHVDQSLIRTDSILVAEGSGIRPEAAIQLGFKSVEYQADKHVIRYNQTGSGLEKTTHTVPSSALRYEFLGQQLLPWNFTKTEFVVRKLSDGKVIARQTDYQWRGTWWEVATKVRVTPLKGCAGVWDTPLLSYVVARK